MSTIIYVGDLHGRMGDLQKITEYADQKDDAAIVQVGDLMFGFCNQPVIKWLEKRAVQEHKTPIFTCFGNHDNWELIYRMWNEQGQPDMVELFPNSKFFYVHRGSLIDIQGISHLFMGGAESTDSFRRKEGLDWWSNEQPCKSEFDKFFENFDIHKPNTIVTHDAPLRIKFSRLRRNQSITAGSLEHVYRLSDHRPRRHYFGHHHIFDKWKVDGTKFYCCGLHGQYFERVE